VHLLFGPGCCFAHACHVTARPSFGEGAEEGGGVPVARPCVKAEFPQR
jgi:hypothetical protein